MIPAQLTELAVICGEHLIKPDALISEQSQVLNWLQEQRP